MTLIVVSDADTRSSVRCVPTTRTTEAEESLSEAVWAVASAEVSVAVSEAAALVEAILVAVVPEAVSDVYPMID